jgi:hypothetical protein
LLLSALLAGCGHDGATTADQAIAAANAQVMQEFPQIRSLEGTEITTRDLGAKWRVDYGGGTGGITVEVDKRSGHAAITEVQQ